MENQDIQKLFGNHLRKLRKENQLSQEKLADMAGITYQYISELERGLKSPSLDILFKISKALKISLCQLLSMPELADTGKEKIHALINELGSKRQEEVLKALQLMLKK